MLSGLLDAGFTLIVPIIIAVFVFYWVKDSRERKA